MSSRDRILDGAAEVMRRRGLANSTTKEIARAAGLSEAMLYKIFQDKVDIFLAVLTERLPQVALVSEGPQTQVGADLPASIRRLAAELVSFYRESFPIAASVFSDPELLARHREQLRARATGPQVTVEAVTAYLSALQEAGRIWQAARPETVAELLVGACLHRAFLISFTDEPATATDIARFAEELSDAVEPLLTGDEFGRARGSVPVSKSMPEGAHRWPE